LVARSSTAAANHELGRNDDSNGTGRGVAKPATDSIKEEIGHLRPVKRHGCGSDLNTSGKRVIRAHCHNRERIRDGYTDPGRSQKEILHDMVLHDENGIWRIWLGQPSFEG